MADFEWQELDDLAVRMTRALAADAVQAAGNGHPGTAMALAPAAYLLFQRHLRHNPADPKWPGRDRFVLSIGHSSITLYLQLFLSGYPMTLSDLQSFRKADSLTPGHPEYGHTAGVETTTGPLGQGIGNAVGLAMALKHEAATVASPAFEALGRPLVYCLTGDGCLQEGVSAEASSLAGHLGLDNLVVIYDDNRISIDGDTHLAFTEDVSGRYRAYGWNVIEVPKLTNGDIDLVGLDRALHAAKATTDKPTLIRMQSTIAWPAPNLQGSAKSHGSPLGAAEIAATKEALGLDPAISFFVDDTALAHARKVANRGADLQSQWQAAFSAFSTKDPEAAARFDALHTSPDTAAVAAALPQWETGQKVATRKAGGAVLNALTPVVPQLWGGSADLSESNGTLIEGGGSVTSGSFAARNIHFGIREHGMGAVMNGLALAGLRPYGGTFLVFSDYMRGAVRLAALMQLPVTYVWTHDSIGLGEDGPTHQPIEHLASLRLIPGLAVVRPADANETAAAWLEILERKRPAALALSRQDLPVLTTSDAARTGVQRGGYILSTDENPADVVLVATGSEVSAAAEAAAALRSEGRSVQVVSMPCVEWFLEQTLEYRNSVLPVGVPRVIMEAGATSGWYQFAGGGKVIGIDHFGESADPNLLFERYGVTAAAMASAAREMLG